MIEGWRRDDPPATPQLAVPISVPNACFDAAFKTSHPGIQATGSLCIIAFFYLLRVGEYTKPRTAMRNGQRVSATRTKQFSFNDVGFYKNGNVVSRLSPLSVLLTCDAATLKITNQKNGRMGQTVHQEATNKQNCPVRALAHRIAHISNNRLSPDDNHLLCEYFHDDEWHSVTSKDIITMVRASAKLLKLGDQGIDPDLIGAHSLRAGGAMALKLHGFDDTTIMKVGRWTSLTFTQYIHNQIAHLAKDISQKMSIPLPFLNIASIERPLPPAPVITA
jgi:hypothetical protein